MINNTCLDICGDGFLMNTSFGVCDDGNAVSGDGCSQSCRVEESHRCYGGGTTAPSYCLYSSAIPISLSLQSTTKKTGQNAGDFSIGFYPAIINLNKMNFSNHTALRCNSNYSITALTYSYGSLGISVEYTADMEGFDCNLTISFDQSLLESPDSLLSFTV